MITKKEEIKEYIDADLNFTTDRNLLRLWLAGNEFYPIVKFIICLRHYEYYYNKGKLGNLSVWEMVKKQWWRFFYRRTQLKYSLYIGVNVAGKGLHLIHPGFRHIMQHQLGENCTVLPMVLVGKKRPGMNATAVIGNNVYISNGATILAPVKIGDNAIIGAGAVVTHDVPAGEVMGGGTRPKTEKAMKVMFVNYGLAMGGAEVIAASYLQRMKENDQDVCLMELMHRPTFLYERLMKVRVPIYSVLHDSNNFFFKLMNYLLGSTLMERRSRKIIEDVKPDIVHLQMFSSKLDLRGVDTNKLFLTIHSDLNRYLRPMKKEGREKLRSLMKEGMHVIVLSEKARRDVLDFCPAADVHNIPNGLDLAKIRSGRYDRRHVCQELNVPEDTFILGHVGRFHPVKNHAKLIDIFDCLHKKRPNSVLLLIGNDSKEEGPHIHEMVAQRGLSDCVKFMGVRSDATALMNGMDAFALTSIQECFPLVSIEAQALGVRCVLTDTVPEEVVCNDNCFALSINAPSETWAELLLGKNVRENCTYSVEDYDLQKVLDATNELYKKALEGKKEKQER